MSGLRAILLILLGVALLVALYMISPPRRRPCVEQPLFSLKGTNVDCRTREKVDDFAPLDRVGP